MNDRIFEGSCLCGSLAIEAVGPPLTEGYCHCESCRRWHAAPVNAWALWKSARVAVLRGESQLQSYDTGASHRHWCGQCGAGLFNRKPRGLTVVYANVLGKSGYNHHPSCHIHCDESVLDLKDDLPQYVDMPAEWGGTGQRIR